MLSNRKVLTVIGICMVFFGSEAIIAHKYFPNLFKKENLSNEQLITRRGDIRIRKMAVTLDAHSASTDPNVAYQILDTLKSQNIKCTFFLTGQFIEKYPDITRRIAEDGHEVGSHLYTHTHADKLTDKQFKKELLDSAKIYKKTTGKKMAPYWRAPGSYEFKTKLKLAHELGFDYIAVTINQTNENTLWDLDSHDWVADKNDSRYLSSEKNMERLLSPTDKSGGIILFHLGSQRMEDPLYPKLSAILTGLKSQGYELTTVSGLLKK